MKIHVIPEDLFDIALAELVLAGHVSIQYNPERSRWEYKATTKLNAEMEFMLREVNK